MKRLQFFILRYWTLFFVSLVRAPVVATMDYWNTDNSILLKLIVSIVIPIITILGIIYYQIYFLLGN